MRLELVQGEKEDENLLCSKVHLLLLWVTIRVQIMVVMVLAAVVGVVLVVGVTTPSTRVKVTYPSYSKVRGEGDTRGFMEQGTNYL